MLIHNRAGIFQSESRIGKGAGDFLAVFFCHALSAGNVVPFASDTLFHLIDYYFSLALLKEKARALRQQVFSMCLASPSPESSARSRRSALTGVDGV